MQGKLTRVSTHSLTQTDIQLTFDNDVSSISSIPSIWSTPLFPGLTVKGAGPFTA